MSIGFYWFRLASDGFEWPRMALDGFEWLRMASNGFGRLRMAVDGFEWLWTASEDSFSESNGSDFKPIEISRCQLKIADPTEATRSEPRP